MQWEQAEEAQILLQMARYKNTQATTIINGYPMSD